MSADTKECPFCGEIIRAQAKKCRYCGEFLDGSTRESVLGDRIQTGDMDDVTAAAVGRQAQAVQTGNVGGSLIQAQGDVILGKSLRDEQYEIVLHWDGQRRLREFDLSQRNLSGLDLSGADLTRANLSGATLDGANLRKANLSGADLYHASLSSTHLEGANLKTAKLNGAFMLDARLAEANLDFADLSHVTATTANLSRTTMRYAKCCEAELDLGAKLRKADLSWADLSRANLSNADLREANLFKANLSEADLSFADLSGATLKGAVLTGAVYTFHTHWPEGFAPRDSGARYDPAAAPDTSLHQVSNLNRTALAVVDRLARALRELSESNLSVTISDADGLLSTDIFCMDQGILNATIDLWAVSEEVRQKALRSRTFIEGLGWHLEQDEEESEDINIYVDFAVHDDRDRQVLANNIIAIMTHVLDCAADRLEIEE